VLTAFFDESGHSDTPGFFALAAFVAPDEAWPQFADNWNAALRAHHAPYLHMREFAHTQGPYRGWTESQRRGLLAACVTAVNQSNAVAVGCVLFVDDFLGLESEARKRLQDPYFCCFQDVVRGAALNGLHEPPGLKVDMVFSLQDEHRGKACLLHEAMLESSDVKERIGALSFLPMEEHPPLQAADLLAYELRHHYQLGTHAPAPPTRWAFRQIVEYQNRVLGAQMLKYIPRWELEAQARHVYGTFLDMLREDPNLMATHLAASLPQLR